MGIIHWIIKTIQGKEKPKDKIFSTKEESQNNKIEIWDDNRDLVNGMKFCATMQLRTPLRVLLRHGEIHTDINSKPPQIAIEMWEGIWLLKTATWAELGIDLPERGWGTMASDIGQIPQDGGEYIKFLIAVRKIVESHDLVDSRIRRLREMPLTKDWETYVNKHGRPSHISKSTGMDWIIAYFFPHFINTIPKINAETIAELSRLELDTPNRIALAPDESLLGIKGIGHSKLKVIRDYCASITNNRDADRIENVTR